MKKEPLWGTEKTLIRVSVCDTSHLHSVVVKCVRRAEALSPLLQSIASSLLCPPPFTPPLCKERNLKPFLPRSQRTPSPTLGLPPSHPSLLQHRKTLIHLVPLSPRAPSLCVPGCPPSRPSHRLMQQKQQQQQTPEAFLLPSSLPPETCPPTRPVGCCPCSACLIPVRPRALWCNAEAAKTKKEASQNTHCRNRDAK